MATRVSRGNSSVVRSQTDEQNPLAGDANADDLILWMAYKEAQAMIHFDAAPTAPNHSGEGSPRR